MFLSLRRLDHSEPIIQLIWLLCSMRHMTSLPWFEPWLSEEEGKILVVRHYLINRFIRIDPSPVRALWLSLNLVWVFRQRCCLCDEITQSQAALLGCDVWCALPLGATWSLVARAPVLAWLACVLSWVLCHGWCWVSIVPVFVMDHVVRHLSRAWCSAVDHCVLFRTTCMVLKHCIVLCTTLDAQVASVDMVIVSACVVVGQLFQKVDILRSTCWLFGAIPHAILLWTSSFIFLFVQVILLMSSLWI